ncbi:Helix-turn-helix domain-containing protein [Lentzea albidocapillata subsp. violacea]|uniref:Helix-turn-helix domain-containing protein n=1 Tax=Lentzea albidocapillata subsp. violacea TaxID=128104 RepID=A0A1G9YXW0_9PSEU|nr:helix-turn-helix transcriptional regulator [Lentzea albidocapillata]SDN14029.1 Helix-turn-helix domain-containing protein [Lentzea albidocapillata subsp. violacea]
MAVLDDALARKWLTAVELANTRDEAGLTQTALAKALGVSQGLVGHWEKWKYFPSEDHLRKWYEVCGAPAEAADLLVELATRPESRSWLARWKKIIPDDHFTRRYLGAEGLAAGLFIYVQMYVPALFQIPEYAAAATAPSARVPPEHQQLIVDLRMYRQQRVLDGDLHVTTVIEEDALDRPIAGHDVMQAQLRHLLTMAELPNCDIRIIPRDAGRHDGLEGRFTISHFQSAAGLRQAGPVVYVEIPGDAVYVTKQDRVAAYTKSSELLAATALSRAETIKAIEARLAA